MDKLYKITFTNWLGNMSQQLFRGTQEECKEFANKFADRMNCTYVIEEK